MYSMPKQNILNFRVLNHLTLCITSSECLIFWLYLLPEILSSPARCTTILRVFANTNFGNRRLLVDISNEAHWISIVIKNGHVSAAIKIETVHFTSKIFSNIIKLYLQWGISSGLSFLVFCPRYLQKSFDLSPSNHVFSNFIPSYKYIKILIIQ
jgi:hypothetical protein